MEFFTMEKALLAGRALLVLAGALTVAVCLQVLVLKVLRAKRLMNAGLTENIVKRTRFPMLALFVVISLSMAMPFIAMPPEWLTQARAILKPISVLCVGWLMVAIIYGFGHWLAFRYAAKEKNTLHARRIVTQIRLFMRIVSVILVALTLMGVALAIPSLRTFGISLFASAGVAGIVLGFAAKATLSNLIAGVQLALTQPILLGDEVVVNDEFGTIDEINTSYVVVKLWDLRRLIIPLNYFMEHPFENWTYQSSDLQGTAYLYADYSVPVEEIRKKLVQVVGDSPLWDGKTCVLLVTGVKENAVELRATVSAANAGNLFRLRCEVREKLVAFLQARYPDSLPQTRYLSVAEPPAPPKERNGLFGRTRHA